MGTLLFGTDACIEAILAKRVYFIIVAEDASQRTKDKMKRICEENHISFCEYGNIEQISKAIGSRNKAIIGIKNKNLSIQIEKNINGGDSIG